MSKEGLTFEDLANELIRREEAMESLAGYIHYVSGLEPPKHIKYLCEKLEAVARGEIKRLMISMPPGHAKSFTASQHFPVWYLSKYGDKNLICATHTQELSDSFGLRVRNIIKSDEHRRIFPEAGISSDKTAAGEWMTLEGGSYKAVNYNFNVTAQELPLHELRAMVAKKLSLGGPVIDAEYENIPGPEEG